MELNQVLEDIRTYVKKSAGSNVSAINDNTRLFVEGYFDSIRLVSLIAFLEEKYAFQIADEEMMEENFSSIASISGFVVSKVKN